MLEVIAKGRDKCSVITRIKQSFIRLLKIGDEMLKWTIVFFILAIIAGVFGFGGLATGFAFAAKILFFGFIALMILSLVGQGLRALDA
jgi:uncharacterized membrane protein YtjA (UPF0391 family)